MEDRILVKRGLHTRPAVTPERKKFYEKVDPLAVAPLWERLHTIMSKEPRMRAAPHIWKYDQIRPSLMETGNLITAAEAERRVLILENPSLKGETAAADSLFAGLQLIMPGEVATTHRHSPSALRFIVEGNSAYTAINGEKAPMKVGDLILTPSMVWHDHGNIGGEPVVWLDGLDIPLIRSLGTMFTDVYDGGGTHPEGRPPYDNVARFGANMRPMNYEAEGLHSPVFHYPYVNSKKALLELQKADDIDPCHGIKLQYINPNTGAPVMATLDCYLQLIPKKFQTLDYQSTGTWIYSVVEGMGKTIIGENTFEWGPRDNFVVPGWLPHHHVVGSDDTILFSFSDKGTQEKLGLYRERRGNFES